jgi:hypothetical protein
LWVSFLWVAIAIVVALAGCDGAVAEPSRGSPAGTMLTQVPEQRGLAGRYPGDKGLASDPAVVLADDFESSIRPWDRTSGGVTFIGEPAHVHGGRQALQLSTNGPGGGGVIKYLSPGFDRLFLRYYIKYDDAFPGAHHVGGVMSARATGVPDANPGVIPNGTNQFDVLLDHWSFDPKFPSPGQLVAYVYHMDQQHEWGEQFYPSGRTSPGVNAARGIFGPSFLPRTDFIPARGRWYCFELMIQANTAGQRDGRVAFWVDGRLAADFPNLRFRTTDALKINRAAVTLYESRNNGLHRVWIDDVVVATTYIGPMITDR